MSFDFIGPIVDHPPRWWFTGLILVVALLAGAGCVRLALGHAVRLLTSRRSDGTSVLVPSGPGHDARGDLPYAACLFTGTGFTPAHWVGVLLYGGMTVAFYGCHGCTVVFLAAFVGAGMLLALAVIDARASMLPDALTLPLLWLGLAVAWFGGPVSLHDAVGGAIVGYGFPWLLFHGYRLVRGRDGMGYGDFKLLAALGAWLGPRSAMLVLLVACAGGVFFACVRQRTLRPTGAYPFGPFLALSGAALLLARCIL